MGIGAIFRRIVKSVHDPVDYRKIAKSQAGDAVARREQARAEGETIGRQGGVG